METTENARYSYVFHYYRHLMTKQEHLAYRNLMRTRRMTGRTDVAAQAKARSMWQDPKLTPLSDDPEVLHLASEGLWVFVTRTVQRILAEHPDKVAFNNCPRCSALARTPRARQCRFCGFDWHAV